MSKLNMNEVFQAAEEGDSAGFCTACGSEAHGVEPDARNYTCEVCGEDKVFGAEEILLGCI